MAEVSYEETFKKYYFANGGKLFKSIQLIVKNHKYDYDIYWGKPEIIFDLHSVEAFLPLAITTIPHRYNYPNPRIYIHESISKDERTFEMIVAHEIGHLWLHDIVGFNNPSTSLYMTTEESEKWADYFSFCYLTKFRIGMNIETFVSLLEEASQLQMQIYNTEETDSHVNFPKKVMIFKLFEQSIRQNLELKNQFVTEMKERIDITVECIGDIFN